jgi:DNA replication protein DnaC
VGGFIDGRHAVTDHVIVTSNKPFGWWGEVFGEDVVVAAMIDRLDLLEESRPGGPCGCPKPGSRYATW